MLLLRGHDPARPETPIWHAPGGGIELDEGDREAAAREFREETGHVVELGALVWVREAEFSYGGVFYRTDEVYFLAEVGAEFEPSSHGHTEAEAQFLSGHGWFSPQDMRALAAPDLLAPPDLADRLEDLVREGPPPSPVRLQGAVLP